MRSLVLRATATTNIFHKQKLGLVHALSIPVSQHGPEALLIRQTLDLLCTTVILLVVLFMSFSPRLLFRIQYLLFS
jgi:hypothetical protein